MTRLDTLFDTKGIIFRPKSVKKKSNPKPKKSGCKITQNLNKKELPKTRFSFCGNAAEIISAFKYIAYGRSEDGCEIHFVCINEKLDDAKVYTIQHQDNSVYFTASPQDKKEERHLRTKWAGAFYPITAVAEADGAVQLLIKRSASADDQEDPDEVPDNDG